MKNNQSLGRPIHYFTKLEYGKYSDIPEYEEYLGEENAEVYYEFMDLKTGSREKGIAFHSVPGTPANILAAKDSVNLLEYGEGDYGINPNVSYDDFTIIHKITCSCCFRCSYI